MLDQPLAAFQKALQNMSRGSQIYEYQEDGLKEVFCGIHHRYNDGKCCSVLHTPLQKQMI